MKKSFTTLLFSFLLLSVSSGFAQKAAPSLEEIWYSPKYSASGVSGFRSMNDGESYVQIDVNEEGIQELNRYKIKNGKKVETLVTSSDLEVNGKNISMAYFKFSAKEDKLMFLTDIKSIYRHSYSSYFYVYDIKSKSITPFETQVMYPEFSPDASKVAFVKDNNLSFLDLSTGVEHKLTKDGKQNEIINGAVDWVYEEEFSMSRGYEWNPEGTHIAYYRFDESKVREFSMDIYGNLYPDKEQWKYPKAGESNSEVQIRIADIQSKSSIEANTGDEVDIYLPRIKWTETTGVLSVQRLNRLQNQWEILFVNAKDGSSEVKYKETSETYIDITNNLDFVKGGFYFTSERSGYNHIWYFDLAKKEARAITKGEWDVDNYYGYDADKGCIYINAADQTAIRRSVLAVSVKKGKITSLSSQEGWNTANFTKGFKYYLHTWSSAGTPPVYTLRDAKGKEVRVLNDNKSLKETLGNTTLGEIKFNQIKTEEGVTLNYYMITPANFDPNKKYPMLMYVYGGPGSQTVKDAWGGSYYMWFNYLASQGYVIVSVDNRGTGFRGEQFKKSTYLQLGKLEIQDQIAAAKSFGKLSYIDDTRIGMFGWSFGGYMSSLAITKGADVFKTAVAVAPVTNWRYYDNIYTERFMRTPQENGASYDANSPLSHVSKIKGNYLIIHGTADDNVHFQNTVEMVDEMIKKNIKFDSEFYPNKNHGIGGGVTRLHLFNRISEYLIENL